MSKIVLITGVRGGIGGATARVFKEAGWHVMGVDLHRADTSDVHHFIRADLSDEAESRRVFSEVTDHGGRIDCLVNNAAVQICRPLVETTPDEWDALMASNLRSVYLAVRQSYPLMRAHGGAIVNIGSVHAMATSAGMAAYVTTKGGLTALTRALAIELAPDRIRVNAVSPGAVDTPMLRSGLTRGHLQKEDPKKQLEEIARRTVMGRVGNPGEIAQAILFLGDEKRSSFITGHVLVVDGGATSKLSTE